MSSLREFARLINEANGTSINHTGAKRRLELLGASVEDLKSPAKVQHLLKMCTEPPCIWTMYDQLMVRSIKAEKEVAELKETVTVLKVESADHLQAIAKLNDMIDVMQVDADKATDRIQQLEEECERLRARIDQLEKSKDEYIYKDDPSYVEED